MTIASQTSRISYNGDGSTTVFQVPFYFQANLDIIVNVLSPTNVTTLQTLGTDYTLSGAGDTSGGSCTFVTAPASGYRVTIYRDPPATQTASYNNNDPFPAKSHEGALDKLTMLCQRLKDRLGRAMTLPESSTYTGLTLPDPEAGKYLKWKADISGLENTSDVTFAPNSYPIATQSEAEAGTSNVVLMTPLRTQQALDDAFGSPLSSIVGISPIGVRATLTSGVPITTTDVAAASQIFCTPFISAWVKTWNGTVDVLSEIGEIILNLDSDTSHPGYHQSGKNFDLYVAISGGNVIFGTGPAYASDSSRGTGAGTTEVEFYKGLWRNKNSIDLRTQAATSDVTTIPARQATLIASFRATANGQASDTLLRRFLSNAYNPAQRQMFANGEALGTSWTYTTATFRQVHANTANKVEFIQCLPGGGVKATAFGTAQNSAGNILTFTGIGVSSTTVNSAKGGLGPVLAANVTTMGIAEYRGYAALGYSYLAWLEASAASGTTTWLSGDSVFNAFQSGIQAEVWS